MIFYYLFVIVLKKQHNKPIFCYLILNVFDTILIFFLTKNTLFKVINYKVYNGTIQNYDVY